MNENDRYYKAIQEHSAELKKLAAEEKAIQARKQKLLQLIAANVNMLPDAEQERLISEIAEMLPPAGLSEATLRILPIDSYLGATEVRDKLLADGYDFSGQANPLASIHTTLKRLVESDDAITSSRDGKTVYKRIGPLRKAGRMSLASLRPPIAVERPRSLLEILAGAERPTEPSRGSGTRASSGMPPSLRIRKPVGPDADKKK